MNSCLFIRNFNYNFLIKYKTYKSAVASHIPYSAFETCDGAVGCIIIGKSQTIVSIFITVGGSQAVSPLQFKAVTAVTNSKCSLHFKAIISVSKDCVTCSGTGRERWVWRKPTLEFRTNLLPKLPNNSNCTINCDRYYQNSWCFEYDVTTDSSPGLLDWCPPIRKRFFSGTTSWLCRVTEYCSDQHQDIEN